MHTHFSEIVSTSLQLSVGAKYFNRIKCRKQFIINFAMKIQTAID
jgi:hypothetical protein